MRWRVKNIPADERKAARDAAKAAGMPLGPWLTRAILRARGDSPAVPRADAPILAAVPTLGNAPSEIQPPAVSNARELADDDALARRPARRATGGDDLADDDASARGVADHDAGGHDLARPAPGKFRGFSSILPSRRAKLAAAAAIIAIVAILGAITLWNFPPATRDAQQAAGAGQSSRPPQTPAGSRDAQQAAGAEQSSRPPQAPAEIARHPGSAAAIAGRDRRGAAARCGERRCHGAA